MVGVFSFLLLVSLIVFAVALILLVIRLIKKQSRKKPVMLMAISLLLVLFSSIGIDKTYHPTAEQTAKREQIAVEKDTEKEDSNESLDMSKPDSVSDETANTSFAFAESTVSEKDKRDSEISETTKPGFVPDETTDIFSVAAESTVSEKDKNTTLEKEILESDKLEVSFDVSVDENGGKPIFTINTNLPDETNLMLTLNGNNYTAQTQVTVKNGITSSNAFSSNGNSLTDGEYVLTVSMSIPKLQPDNVRAIIGESGENMTGEYVEASGIGDNMYLSGDFQFSFSNFGYAEDESNSVYDSLVEEILYSAQISECPVMNGTKTERIGSYARIVMSKDNMKSLTPEQMFKFASDVIRPLQGEYNWFTIKMNDDTGMIFYGCGFTFDYGIVDRYGELETVLGSGFLNDDMTAYEYFTIEEIEQME